MNNHSRKELLKRWLGNDRTFPLENKELKRAPTHSRRAAFKTAAASAISFSIITLFTTNTKKKNVTRSRFNIFILQKLHQQTFEIEIFSQPKKKLAKFATRRNN
jgi:hypothetical protein